MTRLSALIAALTAATYVVLVWILIFQIKPHAGGNLPLDLRLLGYTPDDARAFLHHLDPMGRMIYQNQVRWVDTVFPVLLAFVLGRLTFVTSSQFHLWSRVVLLVPVAGYVVMDLCENALIQELLRAEAADFSQETAHLASQFTTTKFVLLSVSIALVLWLVARKLKQDRVA